MPALARPLHVASGLERKLCCEGAVVHRFSAFGAMTSCERSSLPVLNPAETLCTLAAVCSPGQLVGLIGKADRMRLTTPTETAEVAERLGRFKGKATLRQALRRVGRDGLAHSELERLARRLLREAGLSPHGRPHTVLDRYGRMVAEVDIAFVGARVAVAIDGPHHGHAGQRRLDEDQRQQLEALGWIVVRADEFRLVHEPERFVRQVRDALSRRGS